MRTVGSLLVFLGPPSELLDVDEGVSLSGPQTLFGGFGMSAFDADSLDPMSSPEMKGKVEVCDPRPHPLAKQVIEGNCVQGFFEQSSSCDIQRAVRDRVGDAMSHEN